MTAVLCLVLAAPAAPAPPVRPARLGPGDWVLCWGGARVAVRLGEGGRWSCLSAPWGAAGWAGDWRWDAASGTLTVRESAPGGTAVTWVVRLDARLRGAAWLGALEVPVRLAPAARAGRPELRLRSPCR